MFSIKNSINKSFLLVLHYINLSWKILQRGMLQSTQKRFWRHSDDWSILWVKIYTPLIPGPSSVSILLCLDSELRFKPLLVCVLLIVSRLEGHSFLFLPTPHSRTEDNRLFYRLFSFGRNPIIYGRKRKVILIVFNHCVYI